MSGIVTVLDEATIRGVVADVIRAELGQVVQAIGTLAKPPDLDCLLTRDEVIALLQVDRRSLQRLIHEGVLPRGIIFGQRRLRWRRSTIVAVIERLEQESKTPALRRSRSRGSVSGVTKTTGAAS